MKTLNRLVPVFLLMVVSTSHVVFAQGPLVYNVSVNIAPVTIFGDTYSLTVSHIVVAPQNQRVLNLTVKPAGGGLQNFDPVFVGEVETFVAAATQLVSLIGLNGSPITVTGATLPMSLNLVQVTPTPTFSVFAGGLSGTYMLEIHQPPALPSFTRTYSVPNIQAFVSYLNLGISFVNALP